MRLSATIDQSKPFVLIGLSFGGILVSEINKFMKPTKSIIFSSVSNRYQLPWYYRLIAFLRIHKILPYSFLKQPSFIIYKVFSLKTEEEKLLLTQILNDTKVPFLKWAIDAIITWNQEESIPNLLHIHGTNDHIFPIRFVNPNYKIDQGGHFMVFSHATEVNAILQHELSGL